MLTEGHADDATQAPALLGQAKGVIGSMTADGACDGGPACAAVAAQRHHPTVEVVISPRASAVLSLDSNDGGTQSQRDLHIQFMAKRGRLQAAPRLSLRESLRDELAEDDRIQQSQSGRNSHVQA